MICSYLVVSEEGATERVAEQLAALPGCDVVSAENRDVLILVTDSPGLEAESALRQRVEALDGIQALLLTFGEIDPDAPIADPLAADLHADQKQTRRLPVLDSAGRGGSVP